MKKSFEKFAQKTSIVIVLMAFLFISNCKKSIVENQIEPYTAASIDTTGGGWKTIVVNPGTVTVAVPADPTSASYLAELADLKATMAAATGDQKDAARYWSAGAVRWNEIARELEAKYNLPPQPNPDGTYPVPSSTNPAGPPKYPFANPPYASRSYAYLSVAQYDALVAAWLYKFVYKRPAPSKVDPTIVPILFSADLPAFPSEDAVIAAASGKLLKFFFPLDSDMINQKITEHENSRLWAGANVRSDIAAGDALGKTIAATIIAKAKTDGMKNAVGSQPKWDSLYNDALNRVTTPWISREHPPRPPMLPFFGMVTNWNFDAATRATLRPGPPPAIGSAEFNTALNELKGFSKNLTREQYRIADFWNDGLGTPTPAGHWNKTACDLIVQYKMNQLRAARTLALLNTAEMDAGVCCWDTKMYYYYPRPSQVDPSITTAIGIPNFPSYTSGHATFSAAAATVLGYIFPAESGNLTSLAKEASESRIYAAIHYRFDCDAGFMCGEKIGQYAVTRGQADGSLQ